MEHGTTNAGTRSTNDTRVIPWIDLTGSVSSVTLGFMSGGGSDSESREAQTCVHRMRMVGRL